jgi:hypothetical protein
VRRETQESGGEADGSIGWGEDAVASGVDEATPALVEPITRVLAAARPHRPACASPAAVELFAACCFGRWSANASRDQTARARWRGVGPAAQLGACRVQHLVLEEDDRVVVADGRLEQAARVLGRIGSDHLWGGGARMQARERE